MRSLSEFSTRPSTLLVAIADQVVNMHTLEHIETLARTIFPLSVVSFLIFKMVHFEITLLDRKSKHRPVFFFRRSACPETKHICCMMENTLVCGTVCHLQSPRDHLQSANCSVEGSKSSSNSAFPLLHIRKGESRP